VVVVVVVVVVVAAAYRPINNSAKIQNIDTDNKSQNTAWNYNKYN